MKELEINRALFASSKVANNTQRFFFVLSGYLGIHLGQKANG